MAISEDPDQMLSAVSDLGVHCLLRPVCPSTYDYYGIIMKMDYTALSETSQQSQEKAIILILGMSPNRPKSVPYLT